MTTRFDYIKLIVDNLRYIIPTVLLVVSSLGTTLGFAYVDNADKDKELADSKIQMTNIVNHLSAPKKVVVQSNCNRCIRLINELKEFHP